MPESNESLLDRASNTAIDDFRAIWDGVVDLATNTSASEVLPMLGHVPEQLTELPGAIWHGLNDFIGRGAEAAFGTDQQRREFLGDALGHWYVGTLLQAPRTLQGLQAANAVGRFIQSAGAGGGATGGAGIAAADLARGAATAAIESARPDADDMEIAGAGIPIPSSPARRTTGLFEGVSEDIARRAEEQQGRLDEYRGMHRRNGEVGGQGACAGITSCVLHRLNTPDADLTPEQVRHIAENAADDFIQDVPQLPRRQNLAGYAEEVHAAQAGAEAVPPGSTGYLQVRHSMAEPGGHRVPVMATGRDVLVYEANEGGWMPIREWADAPSVRGRYQSMRPITWITEPVPAAPRLIASEAIDLNAAMWGQYRAVRGPNGEFIGLEPNPARAARPVTPPDPPLDHVIPGNMRMVRGANGEYELQPIPPRRRN